MNDDIYKASMMLIKIVGISVLAAAGFLIDTHRKLITKRAETEARFYAILNKNSTLLKSQQNKRS